MVFGPSGRDHDSQNQYYSSLETPNVSNNSTSIPDHVRIFRLGILIFVIFSFEGALMSSRVSHSIGAINDNSNWWILGWSKTVGDLRVSHFIGMHALQILPLLSFYILKNTKATIVISIIYGLLAASTLVQALNGKPIITQKEIKESE